MLIAFLGVNLETSDKVTGHPWLFDIFKCTSEYPCYPKSFIFPWNEPLILLTSTDVSFLRIATRRQQRPAFRTQCINGLAKNFVCFSPSDAMTDTIFIFPQTTRLNNHWTTLSPFCSTALCHLSSYFTVPSSHNIVLFQTRELFQVSSAVLQGRKIPLQ